MAARYHGILYSLLVLVLYLTIKATEVCKKGEINATGCFTPEIRHSQCTPSGCTHHQFTYHNSKTIEKINVTLSCQKRENILITSAKYLLPYKNHSSLDHCLDTQDDSTNTCFEQSSCNFNSNKKRLFCSKNVDNLKRNWVRVCQNKAGTCTVQVPGRNMTCHNRQYGYCMDPNTLSDNSRCNARWIKICYRCENQAGDKSRKIPTSMNENNSFLEGDNMTSTITVMMTEYTGPSTTLLTGIFIGVSICCVLLSITAITIALVCNRKRQIPDAKGNFQLINTAVIYNSVSETTDINNVAVPTAMPATYASVNKTHKKKPKHGKTLPQLPPVNSTNETNLQASLAAAMVKHIETETKGNSHRTEDESDFEDNSYELTAIPVRNSTDSQNLSIKQMTDNHYYESQDINTTNEQPADTKQSSIKYNQLENERDEGFYFAGGDNSLDTRIPPEGTSDSYEDTKGGPSKTKPGNVFNFEAIQHGSDYSYAYEHFKLEGRKRSPHKV